ncbi:acyl-CoA dehydrogenase family protein [Polynucleobacter kasalickyi]|uniref:3-hydroxy-9,10-secoandrosta-1,3,5(10)-triene-9,17-dione monooxygenase n=1 Tax=Polynucleobacter kasalickyi TaxID=1938817 RepID=A0A1W2ALV3_9BURK|nr:acyl-CoA dehydrogenase family protein [Polynucleobacter kasalickyi]SMC61520.1 3-hydroxy-9,10-secoandrosta-1,3,5(10)-triene-9,17-dione monooxygenase [Polynucleobacter kasalickyi]
MNAPELLNQAENIANHPYKKKSFADVSYDEMIERAKELIPFLASEAAANEKQTHLTPAVVNKLHESGLFRYQQPKLWGGMEVDFRAFMEVPYLLGLGCPSTGWVFANVASHNRQLAQWPMQAQEDIWGEDPNALIASGVAYVQGKGEKVDGGLLLSGYWGFSSGVDICEWNMLSCLVKEEDKVVDWCVCLVPRHEYEIIDDWQTMGMCGTGSRSVKCENVFVPAHRIISMNLRDPKHEFPGFRVHQNSMFKVPTSSVGGNGIAGAMIANARMMLTETTDWIKSKNTTYTGAKMADIPTLQMKIAIADGKIDAAYQWLTGNTIEAELAYKNNVVFDIPTKLKYKRNSAMAMKMANEAVDLLHELLGANGVYEKYQFERRFRDAHASAGHMVFNLDAQLIPFGLVTLGGEFKSPTM